MSERSLLMLPLANLMPPLPGLSGVAGSMKSASDQRHALGPRLRIAEHVGIGGADDAPNGPLQACIYFVNALTDAGFRQVRAGLVRRFDHHRLADKALRAIWTPPRSAAPPRGGGRHASSASLDLLAP
jgi:hypothetical protein